MFFKALLVSSSKFQVYSPQSSQRKTLGWVSQKAIKTFNAEGRGRAIQPYRRGPQRKQQAIKAFLVNTWQFLSLCSLWTLWLNPRLGISPCPPYLRGDQTRVFPCGPLRSDRMGGLRPSALGSYRIQCSVFLFISRQALHHLYRFRFEPEMVDRKRMYYPEKLWCFWLL